MANNRSYRAVPIPLAAVIAVCLLLVFRPSGEPAAMQGSCADCHTMHNSQGGQPMAWDDDGDPTSTPNDTLLLSSCYGCHAQGGNSSFIDLATDRIPQVLHDGTDTDLAGGNFIHIIDYGDNRGHNINGLAGMGRDSALLYPPGVLFEEHKQFWLKKSVACAGANGCHGYRNPEDATKDGIAGAHHTNPDSGSITSPSTPGTSYRFLMGVKGLEDSDWEYTTASGDHNEYFGLTAPIQMNSCDGTNGCHSDQGIRPPDGTMSQFCAGCHGNFHTLGFGSSSDEQDGIGTAAVSPFIRHPTDLKLPAVGEYGDYTSFNPVVPVARTSDAALSGPAAGAGVAPGTDAVMCLSCHRAHATKFPDMLRWNYNDMVAAGGSNSNGCFACHTTKDDP